MWYEEAKHAITLTQSNAITPLQSIAAVRQERGERYREGMAGISERVIGHVELMEPGGGAVNLHVLAGGRAVVRVDQKSE